MKQSSQILVVGSVSYDIIFAIHGNIKDELPLKNGAIGKINLMFAAKNKEKYFGGTGANIAYGLGMLGLSPILFSVAGEDFHHDYKAHLEKLNIDLKIINKPGHTATFYGISDEEYQQIGIWQPNVYGDWIERVNLTDLISEDDLKNVGLAIFSPGTGTSTRNHILNLKKSAPSAKIIFDPSQTLSISYNRDLLIECLSLSDILVGNDMEMEEFKNLFNLTKNDILKLGVSAIFETKGADGCVLYKKDSSVNIQSFKPKKIVETTGAGDAFRSGLMYGLYKGFSLEDSARIGVYMGARNVEEYSGQIYNVGEKDLKKEGLI